MAKVPAEFERFTHSIVDNDQSVTFCLNTGTLAGAPGTWRKAGNFDDPSTFATDSDGDYDFANDIDT